MYSRPRQTHQHAMHQHILKTAAAAARPLLRMLPRRSLSSSFGGRNPVDVKVDEISEQYAIAKDELEIAVEETGKKSIYAAEDRATVRGELAKLENLFKDSVSSSTPEQGEEIRKRVEQRIREFRNAVEELNKADLED